MAEQKSQFENTSGGTAGAVIIDAEGKPKGISVDAGQTIWLSEREQALTANAPRNDEDNPFADGTFTLKIRASDVPTSRTLGDDQDIESPPAAPEQPEEQVEDIREERPPTPETDLETGAASEPEGAAPEGKRAENEEMAKSNIPGIRESSSPVASPGAPPIVPPPPDAD
jgi:hypothetical protein